MRYFDNVLSESPYVAGESLSMADITLLAGLWFAGAAGIVIPHELKTLKEWQAHVSALPSVKNRGGQQFLPEDLKRMGY
jgi:glutathione S-transferase